VKATNRAHKANSWDYSNELYLWPAGLLFGIVPKFNHHYYWLRNIQRMAEIISFNIMNETLFRLDLSMIDFSLKHPNAS
jgi:hypothetical protein